MAELAVFAGTSDARRLLSRLCGRGVSITVSVATPYGAELLKDLPGVSVRAGRMDEAQMCEFLKAFDLALDATHPYALEASRNIASACERAGVPCLRLERPSTAEAADGRFLADIEALRAYLARTEGPILSTLGSKELPALCAGGLLAGRLYARVLPSGAALETCSACGIDTAHVIAMQGPFTESLNAALIESTGAKFLLTKDTGAPGGYEAKIRAAKRMGAQALILGRAPDGAGESEEEILSELEARLRLAPPRKRVTLAGIGMGDRATRTLALEDALREADCLIGAERMLLSVDTAGKRTVPATRAEDIARAIAADDASRQFLALFSGDTGFYSGAARLLPLLADCDVTVLPGVSSLSCLCARLKRPWQDVYPVSLHGREADLIGAVREHRTVFALIGGAHGARDAIARLIDAHLTDVTVSVGERLGAADERVTTARARELAGRDFDSLSALLIENPRAGEVVVTPGLPDDAFERDATPMTKEEVRAVALAKLALTRGAVVYDIGSGSGSVTVEAARMAREGRVYAIEQKEAALALTRRNVEKFALGNVEIVPGSAPEAFENLPAPTHAFIGGSGGGTRQIVGALLEKNPLVRIVASAVTLETVCELTGLSRDFSFSDICQLAVSKPRALGSYHLMSAHNPVYLFTLQGPLVDNTPQPGVVIHQTKEE